MMTRPAPEERFWSKVDKNGPVPGYAPHLGSCWIWIAGRDSHGYGHFLFEGKVRGAHRVAYQWLVGPIPPGLELDHLCRVPACVNPAHLEPVTRRENYMRGLGPTVAGAHQRIKTHCPHGHSYADAIVWRNGRKCRICNRERSREYMARKRAA